jgi:hypothetical protein
MWRFIKSLFVSEYVPGKIRYTGWNGTSMEVNRADWWRERQADWAKMDEIMNPIIQVNQKKSGE